MEKLQKKIFYLGRCMYHDFRSRSAHGLECILLKYCVNTSLPYLSLWHLWATLSLSLPKSEVMLKFHSLWWVMIASPHLAQWLSFPPRSWTPPLPWSGAAQPGPFWAPPEPWRQSRSFSVCKSFQALRGLCVSLSTVGAACPGLTCVAVWVFQSVDMALGRLQFLSVVFL